MISPEIAFAESVVLENLFISGNIEKIIKNVYPVNIYCLENWSRVLRFAIRCMFASVAEVDLARQPAQAIAAALRAISDECLGP